MYNMPFDFFNISHLAFGNKITAAFKSLASKLDECNVHISTLSEMISAYNMFSGTNYLVPIPDSGLDAVQGNQIYNILKIKPYIVKELSFDEENCTITFKAIVINPSTNKITKIEGTSPADLTKGFAYVTLNSSNDKINTAKAIQFASLDRYDNFIETSSTQILFKYVIETGSPKRVTLSALNQYIDLFPSNYDGHDNKCTLTTISNNYTAQNYEIILGKMTWNDNARRTPMTVTLYKNESDSTGSIIRTFGPGNFAYYSQSTQPFVVYIKPGERIVTDGVFQLWRLQYSTERSVY